MLKYKPMQRASDLKRSDWVLIVEDDVALRSTIEEALNGEKFRAVVAGKVAEAIQKLNNQKFDCVLLDLHFELRSGEQVLEHMRGDAHGFNKDTPVIIISGNIDPQVIKRIGKQTSAVLVKPFSLADLISKVRAVIAQRREQESAKGDAQPQDRAGQRPAD